LPRSSHSSGVTMAAQSRTSAAQHDPSVRVFTLGRFRIEVENAPLQSGRKAQHKPIDFLKLLVAYGGESVCAEQIAEDLWPDSDGDRALAALRTTLSRLRKLIGVKAVLGEGRGFTLNPETCWVDALALSQLLAASNFTHQRGCNEQAHSALEDALSIYRGSFLPGECELPPVLAARAKLRSLFMRHMTALGNCYEQSGQFTRAMDLYRKGLEIDETAEDITRKLMQCCRKSGRMAEGIVAYRSCKLVLQTRLGIEPSAATHSAYRDLVAFAEQKTTRQRPDATPFPARVIGATRADLSVAVLPFDDLSPLGDHRRLAEAIRETTISLLGTLPQLSLVTVLKSGADWNVASNGGLSHPGSAVRYLLQGNVMVSANHLRATVQLIDARTRRHVWSEQLDHTLHDVIEARDQVAIKVAEGLAAKLVFGDARLLLSPNIHVWKTLTLVRVLVDRQRRQDHMRARSLLGRMLELEPQEPLALAQHASMHVMDYWKRWTADPAKSLWIGEQTLRKLQKRYAYDGRGMHALAWACAMRGDFDEALQRAGKDVDRRPENFFTHAFHGIPLLLKGRHAEALDKLTDAVHVRPQPLHWLHMTRGVAQFCMGHYDEAASDLATVLVDEYPLHRDSDLLNTRMVYVANLAAAGKAEQARDEARATLAAHPSLSTRQWCRWHFQPYKYKSPAMRMERLLIAAGLPV
jgi:DNA-binding SARP family transcriptional activator